MKKKIFLLLYFLMVFFLLLFIFSNESNAADPTLVTTLTGAFTKLKGYIIKIATSFVAVAITTGLLIRKFSLGDEKKIYKANSIIKGSIISYVLILCVDGILSLITTTLGI